MTDLLPSGFVTCLILLCKRPVLGRGKQRLATRLEVNRVLQIAHLFGVPATRLARLYSPSCAPAKLQEQPCVPGYSPSCSVWRSNL